MSKLSMQSPKESQQSVIRISLRWVLLGTLSIAVIGAVGGMIGSSFISPPLPPLSEGQDRLVTTVQEVTISPSTATASLVERYDRSVLALTTETASGEQLVQGIAVVLTNDGLLVSPLDLSGDAIVVFDGAGRKTPVSKVGRDAIYGLSYYRLSNAVVPPFEMASGDPAIGSTLLGISRSQISLTPQAVSWQVSEYTLPGGSAPAGWQRLLHVTSPTADVASGTPLLDDEGRLSAMLLSGANGAALSVSDIRASLDRVTTNQRELNPLAVWGFSLDYQFRFSSDRTRRDFVAAIAAVTPESPAATAGLKVGDVIQRIDETPVTWNTNVVEQLKELQTHTISILRGEQTISVTINPPTN